MNQSITKVLGSTKVLGPLVADETIKKTAIFVLGAGNIGKYLIDRLKNSCDYYLFGYSTSKTLFINNGIDSEMKEYNIIDFSKIIENKKNLLIVDCSNNKEIPNNLYKKLIIDGNKLVLCNKTGLCQDISLFEFLYSNYDKVRFESTVMAGIPVVYTINSLLHSGDSIIGIEAVLSGSLSFIFNTFYQENSRCFSNIVEEAVYRGYTEPDFWIDLSGVDVARKIIILARMIGSKINIDDCIVNPVIDNSKIEKNLVYFDDKMESLRKTQFVPKYIAKIDVKNGLDNIKCSVSTELLPLDHYFCNLKKTECAILIKTKFIPTGILLQGPGAGKESTIFGILSDIQNLSSVN
jgi:homoserine dehydrogenase